MIVSCSRHALRRRLRRGPRPLSRPMIATCAGWAPKDRAQPSCRTSGAPCGGANAGVYMKRSRRPAGPRRPQRVRGTHGVGPGAQACCGPRVLVSRARPGALPRRGTSRPGAGWCGRELPRRGTSGWRGTGDRAGSGGRSGQPRSAPGGPPNGPFTEGTPAPAFATPSKPGRRGRAAYNPRDPQEVSPRAAPHPCTSVRQPRSPATMAQSQTTVRPPARRRQALHLRLGRRDRRRQRQDEGPPRRQGRGPRRDDPRRPADPSGLHDHHRGLQRLLRGRQAAPGRPVGRRPGRHEAGRGALRQGLRRPEEPAPGLGPLRRQVLDAGHDGHGPQPRPQRGDPPGPDRPDRQRALRLGRLPPLHRDVRPDRHGRPPARRHQPRRLHGRVQPLRRRARRGQARARRQVGHGPRHGRPAGGGRRRTRRSSASRPAASSRPTSTSSSTSPSRPSSPPGSASAPTTTATARRSPTTSARPSTS